MNESFKLSMKRYKAHKYSAKHRKIPFTLTFSQWVNIWITSGHYSKYGTHAGSYVMARHNDKGGYEVGNVSIIPRADNSRDANKGPAVWSGVEQNMAANYFREGRSLEAIGFILGRAPGGVKMKLMRMGVL